MSINLTLYDNIKRGNAQIADLGDGHTGKLRGWRRSIRARGGYWIGESDLYGDRGELLEMYLEGMERRIVERVGSLMTWEGMILEMELTLDGVHYRRSLLPCANAVRAIYSKIGDNLFSNGSVESGAWTIVGTPSTHEQTSAWATRGTYGMHVITDAADEGTEIENGIAITAGRAYQCRVTVQVEAGTWTLKIHRADNDAVLAQRQTAGTGKDVLQAFVSDDNDYAGNVYVRITADAASAEMYADAAVLQLSPYRTETEWVTDDNSIAEWGRIEDVLLEAGMTDAAAAAKSQKEVNERAWPRSLPPDDFEVGPVEREDGLSILFAGYAWTLNWRHIITGGTDTASNHVSAVIGESEFVSAGVIQSNSLSYQVEETDPVRAWDMVEEIILAGDGSGNRWTGGVYAGRVFDYGPASVALDYHYRGGQLLAVHGGAIEPWFAAPGLARLDDAPVGPGEITGNITDDPRNIYIEEVEFIAPDRLEFRREVA